MILLNPVRRVGGFSLHAGVAAQAHESQKLKRLPRNITRPAISENRLSISPQGSVRYELKTPWKNGTMHVEFEPVDLMAHIPVRHPASDLRSSKSAILSIGDRQAGGAGAATACLPHALLRHLDSGHPARCLRAGLRLFECAPGDLVDIDVAARIQ